MKQITFTLKFKDNEYPSHYITDPDLAEVMLRSLLSLPEDTLFGIDTETEALPEYSSYPMAALSPHLSKIRLIQVFDGKVAYVFDLKFIKDLPESLIPFLESRRFIGHYSIFDLKFFKKLGVRNMNIGCTWIATKLLYHATYPSDEGLSASLEGIAKLFFGENVLKKVQDSDWSVEDLTFEQVEYAALDGVLALEIAKKVSVGIKKLHLERIYNLCKDAQHPIAELELNGISLDVEKHRSMISVWRDELYEAKKEVLELTGIDELTSARVGKYLEGALDESTLSIWPRTGGGRLSTDSHTFADFSYLPIVLPFSVFQKKEKLTSSFGHTLIKSINPQTKRLHASYNLCGARTGRLSSSRPNLQQLPRDKEIRSHFLPREGWVFLCADYSQIELRVAAEVTRDRAMLEAYEKGIDLHALTASRIAHKNIEDVTKEDRQMAKAFNFGLLFGLGAKKFSHYAKKSYGTEVTSEEAVEAIEAWRNLYSGYRAWQKEHPQKCVETMTVRTPAGKLRKLDTENCYGGALNTPIQGGAAECMLYSIVRLHRAIKQKPLSAQFCNLVHDELLLECPEDEAEEVSKLIVECMTLGFLDVFPNGVTKGLVEVHKGKNWMEAKG